MIGPSTVSCTQEDPIGLAGGLNLYGYANGDPINNSDPFGLCAKDVRKDQVGEKCRDATAEEGKANLAAARARMASHQRNKVTYPKDQLNPTASEEDCSHFCSSAGHAGGLAHIPYHQTDAFAGSKYYRAVPSSEAQAGDVMWQPGHAGIYTGEADARGRPQGVQMGNSGARVAPFGPSGWFSGGNQLKYYRPLLPREP